MNRETKKQRFLEKRTPYHKDTNGAGFTLVEILVVIAIITALASVAFFSLHIVMVKNRDTIRISDLKQILLGLEIYHLDTGHYPPNSDEIDDDAGGWDVGNVKMGGEDTFIQPLVNQRIFSKTPVETSLSDDDSYRYYHYPADPLYCFGKSFYILAAKMEGSQTNYPATDEVDPCCDDIFNESEDEEDSNFCKSDSWYVLMRFD